MNLKWEKGRQKGQKQRDGIVRVTWPASVSFEHERGPQTKQSEQPLEAKKMKINK